MMSDTTERACEPDITTLARDLAKTSKLNNKKKDYFFLFCQLDFESDYSCKSSIKFRLRCMRFRWSFSICWQI